MKKKDFLGKAISSDKIKDIEVFKNPPGTYDDNFLVLEIFLNDFTCDNFTDRTGRNAYSLRLFLDGENIIKINRIGHCHMCGQGSDDELSRFPHKTLEEEAEDVLSSLLKRRPCAQHCLKLNSEEDERTRETFTPEKRQAGLQTP